MHSFGHYLLNFLGTRQDDSTNVFTARMLLLLESEPLLGKAAYARCVDATLDVYARDAQGDEGFRPTFLTNDIVRYWKTLCLNYEAKRHEYHSERARLAETGGAELEERLAELKVALRVDLLKLRFNRLWTCFNGLAYLLAGVEGEELSKQHARETCDLKPVDRAVNLAQMVPDTEQDLATALTEFAYFLEATDRPKPEVEALVSDDEAYRDMRTRAENFAGAIDAVVRCVADRSGLGRFLLL